MKKVYIQPLCIAYILCPFKIKVSTVKTFLFFFFFFIPCVGNIYVDLYILYTHFCVYNVHINIQCLCYYNMFESIFPPLIS